MTLDHPQNILLKMNSIQDNIEYLNKDPNNLLEPSLSLNSFINHPNNFFVQNHLSNNSKEDILNMTKKNDEKLFQNNSTTFTLLFNSLNNINNSFNLFEDNTFKQSLNSNINLNFLDNNKSLIKDNTKLIEPKFYDDSKNDLNNILNKPFLSINPARIKIKESAKYKHRKLFNKFKISHIEHKNKTNNKFKHKRKYKPDDIRKKIKARFHKSIKNIINENLKKAGSKHFFSFLPQIFISSIAKEKNHQVLDLTYKELLQKDFLSEIKEEKYKNKNVDLSKYKNNLRVLDYLDKNPEICQNSGFDIISKMKYSDLLEEYFKSDEFDKAIDKLRQENEEEDYINEYINKAKSYVKFFSEVPFKTNVNKNKKNSSEKNSEIEDNKIENEK